MKNNIKFIFILSIFIGPYLSFGPLYIFHIVMVLMIGLILLEIIKDNKINMGYLNKWYMTLPLIGIPWMLFTGFWSGSILHTLTYLIYFTIGLLIIYSMNYQNSLKRDLLNYVKYIKKILWIILPISFMEIFMNFRLPFSASEYTVWQSEPTVFWGNPNNFATVLNLILPFILFSKNKFKWLIGLVILVVIYYTNSRLNIIAYLIIIALYFLYENKKKIVYFISIGAFSFCILYTLIEKFRLMIKEVMTEFIGIIETIVEFVTMSNDLHVFDSSGVRQNLMLHGIEGLVNSNLLGVGAGASPLLHIIWLGEEGAMHNFWLEILVEQGVMFFIFFIIWYSYLIFKNYKLYRINKTQPQNRIAGAISISLIGFIIGALSPSSTIYMLPMWLMFSLALISIRVNTIKE
ncbi:hypothetical protein P9B03_04535 [Metasolibacillus meyeri]|uniref:O-antigen ligase-related domain-containing protein n=1 Tax=Metasolibacillus meyeri TaxID=1071052 RepID=A0AAW9NKI6_9BACL|nr:O-antigen ligase family protein [Metasolibacillus meyeri]MEC1177742.1 hypothetical protein [Metasolibacillus meyeri]